MQPSVLIVFLFQAASRLVMFRYKQIKLDIVAMPLRLGM